MAVPSKRGDNRRIPFYISEVAPIDPDARTKNITALCAGVLKMIALGGMFAIAIIYDGQFMYVAIGAALIILGISVKQVLDKGVK